MFKIPSTKNLLVCMIILFFSIIIHYFINNNYYNIKLDKEKCPFCYGNNLCALFDNNEINFTNLTLTEKIANTINMKNVYTSNFNGEKVILKKLGHNWELYDIDNIICRDETFLNCPPRKKWYNKDYTPNIVEFLSKDLIINNKDLIRTPKNLKLCSISTINKFVNAIFSLNSHLNTSVMTANIWTTILANAEPLLLQVLNAKNGWPTPIYYGACGRIIVEEYCGKSLHNFETESWLTRAQLALKLLEAAENFTNKHSLFRFYLTDISSDNIVVTQDYQIKFIDLENLIINEKHGSFEDARPHESKDFCENCYAFSPDDICKHSISDHNFYSICKLLLSKKAPWPMMENGLLHSTPKNISEKYPEIFEYIETCADSSKKIKRFEAAKRLIKKLQFIISEEVPN